MPEKAKTTTDDEKEARNSPMTDKTAESLHHLLDQLTERVGEMETQMRQATEQAEGSLRSSADSARQKSKALAGGVESYVREHPVQAVGFAFLAGLVLSSMMRR